MEIFLNYSDVRKCCLFAIDFHEARKSKYDFGNSKITRCQMDCIADVFEGKVGELAFKKIMEQGGVYVDIDFSINSGVCNTDNGQDFKLIQSREPKLKYDVKTIKPYSQWLLVEGHKLDPEIIKSDIYILISAEIPSNLENDISEIPVEDIFCKFRGFAFYQDFFDRNDKPYFSFNNHNIKRLYSPKFLKKCFNQARAKYGVINDRRQLYEFFNDVRIEMNPFLNVGLKAPANYGIPIMWIRKDINELIKIILADEI